mmetsp:Transcript_132648/g.383511  ORF Transcript_132648/g.383511 Transcript_132648/m.383511 type:complete len:137 (+) Transcript_132648:77-487(+)
MEPGNVSTETLRPHAEKLKEWILAQEGFGDFLNAFFVENKAYFDIYQEEHALHYTTLHKTFADKFEQEIQAWLAEEGLREEHLATMLEMGRADDDPDVELVIDTMLDVMDYSRWIKNIFEIKRRIAERKIVRVKRR